MDTRKRKLNRFAFLFLLVLVLSIGIFNYLVDPFALFFYEPYYIKPFKSGYEREFFNIRFKLDKKKKYSTVFVGGSSIWGSFYPETVEQYVPKNEVEILAFEGPSTVDLIYLTKLFVTFHPEVKKVYFAIEYNTLYTDRQEKSVDNYNGDRLTPSELAKMFFSIDTTYLSLKQFRMDIERKRWENNPDARGLYDTNIIYPKIRVAYGNSKIEKRDVQKIIDLSNFLKKRGIEGIFFIPAYHSLHLANMHYDSRDIEIENLKRELTKHMDLYDFAYSSYYTNLSLPKKDGEYVSIHAYNDPLHPSVSLGKIMFESLINKRKDFGLVLTNDNVDSLLKYERIQLQEYMSQNKTTVDKYMKNSTDRFSGDWAYKIHTLCPISDIQKMEQ